MTIRIEMVTDIAGVGVWDPGVDVPEEPKDYRALIESEAQAGRLFFIDTGGDGGYLSDIYVDERPDPGILALYNTPDRAYLIESQSGRLIAGGLEDLGNAHPQITTAEDEFNVTPGRYALRFYDLDYEQFDAHLRDQIGEADLTYYNSRFDGCTQGCLIFIVAFILGPVSWALTDVYPWLWLVTAGFFILGVAYVTIRMRALDKDGRYHDIHQRIGAFEERYPPFIMVITPLTANEQVEGGWHELC